MYRGLRVAVVVPAYNEELFISRALAEIPAWVDRVVVVDDASTDATAVTARHSATPQALILRHETNRGVGAAIATGYDVAFRDGADLVAVMAGDGQMAGADLSRLLNAAIDHGAHYVKGNRLAWPQAQARMPMARYWGTRCLSWLTCAATGLQVTDSQCGYTAISRAAAQQLDLHELWPSYGYPNDLLGLIAAANLRIAEVEVEPIYRDEQSGLGWRHALVVIPWLLGRAWIRRIRAARRLRAGACS